MEGQSTLNSLGILLTCVLSRIWFPRKSWFSTTLHRIMEVVLLMPLLLIWREKSTTSAPISGTTQRVSQKWRNCVPTSRTPTSQWQLPFPKNCSWKNLLFQWKHLLASRNITKPHLAQTRQWVSGSTPLPQPLQWQKHSLHQVFLPEKQTMQRKNKRKC